MMVFPIVSTVNGATVAGHKYDNGAFGLAAALNGHAGNAGLVTVGEPVEWDGNGTWTVDGVAVPVCPAYGRAKDPNKIMLSGLVAVAVEPRKRTRKPATAKSAAKSAAKPATAKSTGGRTRRAPLTAKPQKVGAEA